MENKKNILLVCFSFPPFPGIGGRRWAKFAKHLAKQNFNVHVLAAENTSNQKSEWVDDTMQPNIKLHTFSLGLSKVFSVYPKTVSEKITYKALSLKANLFIKGNKQDKIYFIKSEIFKQADKLISENKIDTLIITIPPYKLSYYLLPLKKKYPQLKLMVDYRDPWTDNKSYHGFANISKEDLAAEIEFEKEVLNTADVVFDVNVQSLQILKNKTSSKAKFIHLPNGFDSADYKYIEPKVDTSPGIRFIYTGSFYPNLIYLLKPIINCLTKLEKTNKDLYRTIRFDFYGNMDHNAIELLKQSNCPAITFHGNLPQKQVLDEINQSEFCLLFSAADHNHALNTKFYEYLYFRKPILYFGGKGEASDFIIKNNIGLAFEPNQIETTLFEFLNSGKLNTFKANSSVDISAFETENITKTLIAAING